MDPHKEEVTNMLLAMGFQSGIIEKAYSQASIKTVEGIINYIEATPSLNSAMQIESQTPTTNEDSGKMQQEDIPTKPEEEPKKKPEENLIPISGHVNSQMRDNLIAMGYKKNPAEKALFMTQNKSTEVALDWLTKHKDLPDFNEPLFIVGNQGGTGGGGIGGGMGGVPKISNLSPEEIKKQARELQKKLAEKLKQKDKALEEERERERLRVGKDMVEAKRKMEEREKRLNVEYLMREKKEKQDAMQKVLAQLEADKYARTGKKPMKKLKPPKEIMSDVVRKMQRVYPPGSMSGPLVKKCLKTCGIYLSKNIFFFNKFF